MTDVGRVRSEKMHVESFAHAITGVLDVCAATHSALNANIRRKLVFVKVAFSAFGVVVAQGVGSTSCGLRAQETCTLHCQVWGVSRPHASESIQEVGARWAALARPGPWPGAVLLHCRWPGLRSSTMLRWLALRWGSCLQGASGARGFFGPLAHPVPLASHA